MCEYGSVRGSLTSPTPEPLYLLQIVTYGYIGNSPQFYGDTSKGAGGYTQWIDCAKRFTAAEADLQIRSTRGSHKWKKWPLKLIEKHAKRTVDIQDLNAARRTKKKAAR